MKETERDWKFIGCLNGRQKNRVQGGLRIMALCCLYFVLCWIFPGAFFAPHSETGRRVVGVLGLLALAGFGVYVFYLVRYRFERERNERFIELECQGEGQVRVSDRAVALIFEQALATVSGVRKLKTSVTGRDGKIQIDAEVSVIRGVPFPEVTRQIQIVARQDVESICGVEVGAINLDIQEIEKHSWMVVLLFRRVMEAVEKFRSEKMEQYMEKARQAALFARQTELHRKQERQGASALLPDPARRDEENLQESKQNK